jgi:hypothetical protein
MTNPLSEHGWSDGDYANLIGTMVGEVDRPNNPIGELEDYQAIADVSMNRGKNPSAFGGHRTLGEVLIDPDEYNAWSTQPQFANSHRQAVSARDAILAELRGQQTRIGEGLRSKIDLAKQGALDIVASGKARGITQGATFYNNPHVGQQAYHQGLADRYGSKTIGEHRFTGHQFDRNITYDPTRPVDSPRERNAAAALAASIRGQAPDISMGQFYGNVAPPPDWDPSLTSPPSQQRGSVSDPFGFSGMSLASMAGPAQIGQSIPGLGPTPDYSAADLGASFIGGQDFGNQSARSGIGLGVNAASPGALGTEAFPSIGPYDTGNLPGSMSIAALGNEAFGPKANTSDVFSPSPLGAPQGFANYGDQPIGYSPAGFSQTPSQPGMSLASLAPGVPQNTSLSAANPYGFGADFPGFGGFAPTAWANPPQEQYKGMERDRIGATRGIVGYEDKPVTTTTQVPNPAYQDWADQFGNKPGTITSQQMYADDLADKLGVNRGYFGAPVATPVAAPAVPPAPSRTIDKTTTTIQHSPRYGDIPVGKPVSFAALAPSLITESVYGSPVGGSWGGPDSWGGLGSGYGALSNSPRGGGGVLGTNVTDALAAGLADMNANPGAYGYGGVSPGSLSGGGGMSLGGMAASYDGGALGGGYGGYSGGYGGIGAVTSGNEQQGGAWGGNGFSGSQGSDPSGRGGLY